MAVAYVSDLTRRSDPSDIGGKAKRSRFLIQRKVWVPPTLVCTWDAYLRFLDGERRVLDLMRLKLQDKLDPDRPYAVRSSASVEDNWQHPFAGQFKTVLNVQGLDDVLHAIESMQRRTKWSISNG
jgi:pyruvate,water dikinase